jgi:hypothetical protein
MYQEKLEIRGIRRHEIVHYLLQMGAKPVPLQQGESTGHYVSDLWQCQVSEETFVTVMRSNVPQVKVSFTFRDPNDSKTVLNKFRLKIWRAGA